MENSNAPNEKNKSIVVVAYEVDGEPREVTITYDRKISKILFPLETAELLIKTSIGEHKSFPKNISVWLDGNVIWSAPNFATANIN